MYELRRVSSSKVVAECISFNEAITKAEELKIKYNENIKITNVDGSFNCLTRHK